MDSKRTMVTLISILIILLAIAGGIWWFVFFGQPNPPLPQTTVTVQTATTTAPITATSTGTLTPVSSSSTTTSTVIASGTDENPTLPEELLSIDNATFTVEIASTMLEQARGLSNRPSLGANDGMLFIFSSGATQSFWMKDMNFPLDIIWISGNTVVGFAQNAPAEPNMTNPISSIVTSPPNTDKVLEVNAGTVVKYNIKVRDTVTIGAIQ